MTDSACLAAESSNKGNSSRSDDPNHASNWVLTNERIIGNGSFGVVYQAVVKQNGKVFCQRHNTARVVGRLPLAVASAVCRRLRSKRCYRISALRCTVVPLPLHMHLHMCMRMCMYMFLIHVQHKISCVVRGITPQLLASESRAADHEDARSHQRDHASSLLLF